MLKGALATTVSVVCLLAITPPGPTAAAARHRHCAVQSRIVAKSRLVIAYVSGRRQEGSRSGALAACRRATGRRLELARNAGGDFWFDRPAHSVAVRGGTVGYAEIIDNDGISPTYATIIVVRSLTKPNRSRSLASLGADVVKVGSVDVTPRGAAAWSECAEADPDNTNGSPHPNCVQPGDPSNSVVVAAVGAKPVQIAQGADIDPVSVRIRSGAVSWIQAGQRRSQPIPAAP